VLTAAAVAALFMAPACGSNGAGSTGGSDTTTAPSTTTSPSESTAVTSTVIEGRPLRRRGRWRRRELLLPVDDRRHALTARAEYASVASFAELALQLMALGAPATLVARCHRAALDEISHAAIADALDGRPHEPFAPVPHLLGRRIGRRCRTRRAQVARLALDSYRDGWLNEGRAAARLDVRAAAASDPNERAALERVAADERGHADLARDVVLWCFELQPRSVGRALPRA
jgi:hypothetical protein